MKNEERSTHIFTREKLGINARLAPGETRSIEIAPDKVGYYIFYSIPHRAPGEGRLGYIPFERFSPTLSSRRVISISLSPDGY